MVHKGVFPISMVSVFVGDTLIPHKYGGMPISQKMALSLELTTGLQFACNVAASVNTDPLQQSVSA